MDGPEHAGPPRPGEVRYGVSVRAVPGRRVDVERVADLDLDRIPGPPGETRLLVDLETIGRLAREGFEVRIHEALPVRPLDPGLVMEDAAVEGWLQERLRGLDAGDAA